MKRYINILIILIMFMCPGITVAAELETNMNIFFENNVFSLKEGLNIFGEKKVDQDFIQNLPRSDWNLYYNTDFCFQLGISNNIKAGYIRQYEGEVLGKEDTIKFLLERLNDSYTENGYSINYYSFNQSLDGIILKKDVNYNEGLFFSINGKLLRGLTLGVSEYRGDVEVGEEVLFNGHKRSIQSSLGQETELYEVDFSSYGVSLGGSVKWKSGSDQWLEFEAGDIVSYIVWNDVYTSDINYRDTMISILGNQVEEECSAQGGTGKSSYREYITHLTPEYTLSMTDGRLNMGLYYNNNLYPFWGYKLLPDKPELEVGMFADHYVFKLKTGWFAGIIKTDNINLSEAKGVAVTVETGIRF